MESKNTLFVLIVIIAVLALALAALAGYLFILQGPSDEEVEGETDTSETKELPNKGDLIKISLFEDKRIYNLKNGESSKTPLLQLNVTLECYRQLKREKKVDVEELVAAYYEEIQELLVRFFLTKTIDDVKNVETMDLAREELIVKINTLLNEGRKNPEDIVYKIIFSEWLSQ